MKDHRQGFFVCFTGIDGSGKTTLSKDLINKMQEIGLSCRYVQCRFNSSILNVLVSGMKKTLSLSGKDMEDYAKRARTREDLLTNRLVSNLYLCFVHLQYFCQIFVNVVLPLAFKKVVICDRYVYDTIVDLAVDFSYPSKKIRNLLSMYFRLIPRPDLVFLIDLPEEVAYSRNLPKGDIPSAAYLSARRAIYLSLAEDCDMIVLDGTKDLDHLLAFVKDMTRQYAL